jgi:hypothetical protein
MHCFASAGGGLAPLLMAVALAACAGPSPDVTPGAADASATASAGDADTDAVAVDPAQIAAEDETTADEEPAESDAAAAPPPPPPSAPAADEPGEAELPPAAESDSEAEPEGAAAEPAPESPALAQGDVALPPAPAAVEPLPRATEAEFAGRKPYVVIRFTSSSVDYEQPLAQAVRRAVERRPEVAFDLVAVTPRASTAEELAEYTQQAAAQSAAVRRSLADLGFGPDRVRMLAWTGQPTDVNEIRLYIR